MKNIKGDILWGAVLLACASFLIVPHLRNAFITFTETFPYLSGFIKFCILATMGDLIGLRILNKKWVIPSHFVIKAAVWGLLGMAITLMFSIFLGGVTAAQTAEKLPFEGMAVGTAILASLTMNTTFGPMLYIYHKFGDYVVDKFLGKDKRLDAVEFTGLIDWNNMVGFFWLKTCAFVWFPLHSIVFLLPAQYRVITSAFLSVLLGIIVALSKSPKNNNGKKIVSDNEDNLDNELAFKTK